MMLPCTKCAGTGKAELPSRLAPTFEAVKSGLQTTTEIYAAAKDRKTVGVTAINRRLERLTLLGVIRRELHKDGSYRYSVNTTTKEE